MLACWWVQACGQGPRTKRNAAMEAETSEHARPFNVVSAHPPKKRKKLGGGAGYKKVRSTWSENILDLPTTHVPRARGTAEPRRARVPPYGVP
eukprot:1779713-Prymnesium_polylepis.1